MDENKVASWCEPSTKTRFQYAQLNVIIGIILISTFLIYLWWGMESRKQELAHEEWLATTTLTQEGKRIEMELIRNGNRCIIRTREFPKQKDGTFDRDIFKQTEEVCSLKQ